MEVRRGQNFAQCKLDARKSSDGPYDWAGFLLDCMRAKGYIRDTKPKGCAEPVEPIVAPIDVKPGATLEETLKAIDKLAIKKPPPTDPPEEFEECYRPQ